MEGVKGVEYLCFQLYNMCLLMKLLQIYCQNFQMISLWGMTFECISTKLSNSLIQNDNSWFKKPSNNSIQRSDIWIHITKYSCNLTSEFLLLKLQTTWCTWVTWVNLTKKWLLDILAIKWPLLFTECMHLPDFFIQLPQYQMQCTGSRSLFLREIIFSVEEKTWQSATQSVMRKMLVSFFA